MQTAIFDASFFLSYLLPDEHGRAEAITQFASQEIKLLEPFIFQLEVANGLRYAWSRKRISKQKLTKLISSFRNLTNIDYVYEANLEQVAELAIKQQLSIYDACYLQLAKTTGVKLYSLDQELVAACKNI